MPSFPRLSRIRRALVATLCAAAASVPSLATAQPASQQPVRLLVGFAPGGGTDVIARLLADKLREPLGRVVIVENKPGAGGQLAAQALKAAAPDGNTFFLSHDHTITILPMVTRNPGYDSQHDFVPVAGFATFVNAFAVSPGTPARTIDEYFAWVKAQGQGKSSVGVPAPASTPEFLVKTLGERYGADLVAVPYRGSAPMINDMLGNQIPAGIGSVPEFVENHKAGKLRVVAVLGGKRQPVLPEVPTFSELGVKGLEDEPYYGVFAPAGTPAPVLEQFAQALAKVIAQPDVKERLTTMGLDVGFMSGKQLAEREAAYRKVWAEIIRKSGFQPQ
jgi:tripartite-type tricarboxylate transporter receptor subunit TctC